MSAREWLDGRDVSHWQPELRDKRTLWKIEDIGKRWGSSFGLSQIANPVTYKSKERAERVAARKQKSVDRINVRKLRPAE